MSTALVQGPGGEAEIVKYSAADHTMNTDGCAICGNFNGNRTFAAREMMFGYRDEFEYLECARCGCLQNLRIPENLARYYPGEYYPATNPEQTQASVLKRFVKRQRARYCLYGANVLGQFLVSIYGMPTSPGFGSPHYYTWLRRCGVRLRSDILEVGCGPGDLLLRLHDDGFTSLTGLDPLIAENIIYKNGVRILKAQIYEIAKQFDFIMLHHAFEHMPEPLATLKQLHRLLRPERYLVIRTPVGSSFAYRKYGADWAQLDAPRHLFVHTTKSVHLLAEASGFQVVGVTYDSFEFQFWASEQYIADIPLHDDRSYAVNPNNCLFSRAQIMDFRHAANELNRRNDGDSACFYLYKA